MNLLLKLLFLFPLGASAWLEQIVLMLYFCAPDSFNFSCGERRICCAPEQQYQTQLPQDVNLSFPEIPEVNHDISFNNAEDQQIYQANLDQANINSRKVRFSNPMNDDYDNMIEFQHVQGGEPNSKNAAIRNWVRTGQFMGKDGLA